MNTQPPIPVHLNLPNILIAAAGAITLFYGLHRIVHFQINKGFWLLNTPVAFMLTIGLWYLFSRPHPSDASESLAVMAARYGLMFMPLMVLLVFVMGLGTVIVNTDRERITALMQAHPLAGTLIAIFITPTSNSLIGIVQEIWKMPNMQPYMLLYLQGSALASVPLFMLRQAGFAPNTGIPPRMYVTGFIACLMMTAFIQPICWLTNLLCEGGGWLWSSMTAVFA